MNLREAGLLAAMSLACVGLWHDQALGATRYHARLLTSPDQWARLGFDFTCNDSAANTVTLLNFGHDGTRAQLVLSGGPITGDILSGSNPADTSTIEGAAFFNEVLLQIAPLGNQIDFDVDLTENAPGVVRPEDEFAFFYLAGEDTVPYPTSDPSGANAMFAIDVTGASGGELTVFSPMTFVPPDTLLLNATLVDVPSWSRPEVARVRFLAISPNPALASVRFAFELPSRGHVELRIYDVAGRLVAQPVRAVLDAGPASAGWNARSSSGQLMPTGFYIAELRQGRQSAVRRFILAR